MSSLASGGRASRGLRSDAFAAAGAGPHRTGRARAAEAQRRMAGEGYFASRCKGAEPRRKMAARQAIARPAPDAAVALQRRPEARLPWEKGVITLSIPTGRAACRRRSLPQEMVRRGNGHETRPKKVLPNQSDA